MYKDRIDAGIVLATRLRKYKDQSCVILAIPPGGVPIAYIIARELNQPMDLLLTKEISHPLNKGYTIGSVSLTNEYIADYEQVLQNDLNEEISQIKEKLKAEYRTLTDRKLPQNIRGKVAIIVDEGITTGTTFIMTVNMLRKQAPSKIVIAVPVASQRAIIKLSKLADELICPLVPEIFWGIDQFYDDFHNVTDREVAMYIDKLSK